MKKLLSILVLGLLLSGNANAEIIKLLCVPENRDPIIFQIDYENNKLKQEPADWGDMYYDDNNIYLANVGKKDPDVGTLAYSKKINRLTGKFTFTPVFLKNNQLKSFLDDVFLERDKLGIDMNNKKLLKILTDEISIRADKKNIVTAQCNKKDKIENKF